MELFVKVYLVVFGTTFFLVGKHAIMGVMHTTRAFIIKKEPYGEADLMLTVLSEQFGKIKVFARGVCKQGAKLRGHCEPMSSSLISFVEGKNMYRLIHAEAREFYPCIRRDFTKLQIAYHCLELADEHLFEDRREAKDFFELLETTFSFLERESDVSGAMQKKVLIWFDANFLRLLGLLPDRATEGLDGFGRKQFQDFYKRPLAESAALASVGPADYGIMQKMFQQYLQ